MTRKRWPALPKALDGLAGPIRVSIRRAEYIAAKDGTSCWGLWQPNERRILVAGRVAPSMRWHSLAHEWCHAWMADAGILNLLSGDDDTRERSAEVICDTFASAFVRTLARQYGLDPWEGANRP